MFTIPAISPQAQAAVSLFRLAWSFVPAIFDAVHQVEAMFPNPGAGAQKAELVLSTIEAGYNTANNTGNAVAAEFSALKPVLIPILNGIVATAKATGTLAPAVSQVPQ